MAVGGTSLNLAANGDYLSESSWASGGGSVSIYQSQPSWQNGVVTQSNTNRAMPDVAFDANPNTGVSIYDTYNNPVSAPWTNIGGTSFATPSWASLVTIAEQGRDLVGLPTLDIAELMTAIYAMPASNFNDITSSGGPPANDAGPGFDLVTGRGTPKALPIVEYLVGLGAISGTVFNDVNGNGVLDSESGLSGWQVYADLDADGVFDSQTVTNGSNNTAYNVSTTSTALSTITVSGLTANVVDVNVSVNIAHSRPSDLVITLIAPDGTEVTLANHDGGIEDDFIGTTFDDSAPKSISVGSGPFTGSYHPTEKLLDLFAKNPNGSWQLRVQDTVFGTNGTLNSWSLQLTTGDPSTVSASDGTYFIDGLPAGTYSIREMLQAPYAQTAPGGGFYSVNLAYAAHVTARNFGNQLPTSQVVGRHVFYNNSAFDGSAANNANDDNAIPSNKTAYLPGGGQTVLANITNYTNGLNGIMVDLAGGSAAHTSINASDFVFKVGTNNAPNTWTVLAATPTISVRTGAGVSGSDRVDITWNNNAIQDTYLEVQVLATAHTGLSAAFGTVSGNAVGDVFYFGNLRGETASTTPGGSFSRIFASDSAAIVSAGTQLSVGINSFLDIDRSNSVIVASDRAALVPLGTAALTRISIGAAGPFVPEGSSGQDVRPLGAATISVSPAATESSSSVEPLTATTSTDAASASGPAPAATANSAPIVVDARLTTIRFGSSTTQAMILPARTRQPDGDEDFASGETATQHGQLERRSAVRSARAEVAGLQELLATADASAWRWIDVDDSTDALDLVDDDLLDLLAAGHGRVDGHQREYAAPLAGR